MSEQQYASGGYIGSYHAPVGWELVHPHECLIAKRDEGFRCIRADHHHSPSDEVMTSARRQIKRWRNLLDRLAER